MDDAISEARVSFDAGHDLWWVPFLGAGTGPPLTHAVLWVERFVRRLLELPELQRELQYQADLVELGRLRAELAPQERFYERAQEIWYRGSGHELANKAISKMFALVADELYAHGSRPLHLYSGVVCNLVEVFGYRPDVFMLAADEFRSVCSLRKQGQGGDRACRPSPVG